MSLSSLQAPQLLAPPRPGAQLFHALAESSTTASNSPMLDVNYVGGRANEVEAAQFRGPAPPPPGRQPLAPQGAGSTPGPCKPIPKNLFVVQDAEQVAKRHQALLPQGALRQRAEQRLKESLGVVAPVAHAPKGRGGEAGQLKGGKAWAPYGTGAAQRLSGVGPRGAGLEEHSGTSPENTTIERAELRALRLFPCSPVCCDPLAVLVISNDLYRRAQQCLVEAHRRLNQLVRSAQEDPLPRAILAICPQLEPHLAALLQRLCIMDAGAREALYQAPEGGMMAILDVLEPVEQFYGT